MGKRIYVAGPYTKGDVEENVRKAIEAGNRLLELGYLPFIPHLTHYWHLLHPNSWEKWIEYDLQWLKICCAVLRLPGESKGADLEGRQAYLWRIAVYHSIEDLLRYDPPGTGV